MSHTHPADEATIREHAYHLWEKDGRPHGRDNEYWMRAVVALSETPPKSAFPSAPAPKAKRTSAVPKAAAASKTKAAPAKAAKAVGKAVAEKKPKKK